jgi:hypothetical protein
MDVRAHLEVIELRAVSNLVDRLGEITQSLLQSLLVLRPSRCTLREHLLLRG